MMLDLPLPFSYLCCLILYIILVFLWFDASSYGGWGCHLWVMMHGGHGLMVLLRMEGGEGIFGLREQVNYLDF